MPLCSINEAFPDTASQSGVVARKEERRRAKKCEGPALTFLKGQDDDDQFALVDPDRPSHKPLPPAEKLKGSEGFENLSDKHVKDIIGKNSLPRAIESPSQLPDLKKDIPNYFGKSVEDIEKYADFNPSNTDRRGYEVMPADFIGSFGLKGIDKPTGKQTLPIPSVKDAWKPLTPVGNDSSFFDELPSPGGRSSELSSFFTKDDKESILKKLDTLFARLEEIEYQKNEYAHAEISLFILSGLFLMFGLESVRKIRFS
jgi:hypothetical protein